VALQSFQDGLHAALDLHDAIVGVEALDLPLELRDPFLGVNLLDLLLDLGDSAPGPAVHESLDLLFGGRDACGELARRDFGFQLPDLRLVDGDLAIDFRLPGRVGVPTPALPGS
jgi:hypothetical protein